MLATKGMRLPMDVILVCIRWYAAYPLRYRHLQEMMQERGVFVDHSSINRWAIRFLPFLEKVFRKQRVGRDSDKIRHFSPQTVVSIRACHQSIPLHT